MRLALLAAAAVLVAAPLVAVARLPARPPAAAAYVDERACVGCHAAQARAWSGSHHARAMQVADATTVLGDFADARFARSGITSRFFRRDGRFLVETEGPDGRPGEFEIRYTFGVAPLQQYVVPFPDGRLQMLTIAWDTTRRRWFDLSPDRRIAPGEALHWTGRYQGWNLMCGECHTTDFRKRYDARRDAYDTRWAALGVGCQACHGPGSAHVVWARAPKTSAPPGDRGLIPSRHPDWRRDVDACGRCHARRVALGASQRPGAPFLDDFRPAALRADLYHPDGQQLGEAFEWGSFLQSRMYQVGVRCTECHDPHTAARPDDDAVCTRCHGETPDARFPMLRAKRYDAPTHHHHARPGSAGARCVACHMPAKTYMVVHPRRDHSFQVPRPDLSAALGTPNACNACHADRPVTWAVAAAERWYGARPREAQYADAIAAGRAGARDAAPRLVALATAVAQPAIVRATALELLRRYGSEGMEAMLRATKDDDPLVRLAAVGGLEALPPVARVQGAAALLADPVRAVRIEAARALAGAPEAALDAGQRRAFGAALAELTGAQAAMADMPASHVAMGRLQERRGEQEAAAASYATALRMDPRLLPARLDLAALDRRMQRDGDAERVLREGLALTPAQGELHYALGLLLAGQRRLPEAADAFAEAVRRLPDSARVHYNHGVALEHLGRLAHAERALQRAAALDGDDPDVVYALVTVFLRQGRYRRALEQAERLTRLTPNDAAARGLVERLRREIAAPPAARE